VTRGAHVIVNACPCIGIWGKLRDMSVAQLPPGLDPVTAGRFGLWLLGKRSHTRAQRRRVSASHVPGSGLAQRFVSLIAPWTIAEYPGRRRLLGGLCGVAVATTDDWLYREQRLPAAHAQRLSTICREKAAQPLELADDLDRHVETREAINAKRRGFMKGQPPSQRLMHVRKIFRPTF